MKFTYLRWKDPDCNGKNIEWEEMSKNEFFEFIKSEQSKGRYFIKLDNDICFDADVVYLEATKQQYDSWAQDDNHHHYLNRFKSRIETLSIDCPLEKEANPLHEIIADIGVDVETEAMERAMIPLLYLAISSLGQKRRNAIIAKYFLYPELSDNEISQILSMSYEAFHDLRFRAINDLKSFFKN